MDVLKRILQVEELRAKLLFTFLMICVCRVAGFIPVPGIDGSMALLYFQSSLGGGQSWFQLVNIFSGGAFSSMTVIALGVVPYITSSIVLQLLVALIPSLQREMKENPEAGKKKIGRYTRLLTLFLSFLQSAVFARYAIYMNLSSPGIIAEEMLAVQVASFPWLFYLIVITTMTTGTLFLMWIGEQITEYGIGNGMSLIIAIGILSQLPTAVGMIIQQLNLESQEPGQMNLSMILLMILIFTGVCWGTIMMVQGQRRIPLQHARRVVGRREMQGVTSYLPLKVNYTGVIPVIFASSILLFPGTVAKFLGIDSSLGDVVNWFRPGSTPYLLLFVFFIFFLNYVWTAMQFRPDQIASDMKRNGAFIPGVRQGHPTQEYLETTMNRVTLVGSICLAILAVLPTVVGNFLGISPTISYFFGGTALLILVGVVLDTMKQIESHLIMKRYDGFLKKGRVRGRSS